MKIGEKCYAAVDDQGNIVSHYEGYLVSGDAKSLRDEMQAWAFCLPSCKIVAIQVVQLDEPEQPWDHEKELKKRDEWLYGHRKKESGGKKKKRK